MIDDDFAPDRLQYRALGHLLVHANNFPLLPWLRETDLLTKVYGKYVGSDRQEWLTELAEYGLIRIVSDELQVGDLLETNPVNVCLTAAGIYYTVSRAFAFGIIPLTHGTI
jgi:hypothetical protein